MKKCLEFPYKNRYNTKQDGETAILLSSDRHLQVYYCDTCDGWHLASKYTKRMRDSL